MLDVLAVQVLTAAVLIGVILDAVRRHNRDMEALVNGLIADSNAQADRLMAELGSPPRPPAPPLAPPGPGPWRDALGGPDPADLAPDTLFARNPYAVLLRPR